MNDVINSKIRLEVPVSAEGTEATITNSNGGTRTVTLSSPITDVLIPGMDQYRVQAVFTDETVVLGYGHIKKVRIFDTSWQTAPNEDIATMLDKYRSGIIDIQDYWNIGDIRPIQIPYVTAESSSTYMIGPIAAHDNGLKIAKFGDSKAIRSGSNKAIICVFSNQTPGVSMQNIFDATSMRNFYTSNIYTAMQSALGTLSSYLRSFTKYYTRYYNSNYYINSVTANCSGLSCLDVLPANTGYAISADYREQLPVFPNGTVYNGVTSFMDKFDGNSSYNWASGTDNTGTPKPSGYLSKIYVRFAALIVL